MNSRSFNSKRNIISGLILQTVNIILPFVTRTAIIYILGELYAGLSGLFTSVLQVLNLADLGFSAAVIYILYKPIAEKNWDEVCAIVLYLKRIYLFVGTVILICGLCITPFLHLFINGSVPENVNIYILFVIYLINTAISYLFFAYKSALLTAMQRDDVVSIIGVITGLITKLAQLLILIFTRNYYLYLIIAPIGTIINNILYQRESVRLFPQVTPKGRISPETKKLLSKQIRGIVFNRVGDVARNSFDNIILSSILGLTMVAVYNNYYLIYSSVYGITLVITRAVQASVGNSLVTESVEKNYSDLRKFTYLFTFFTSICTVCMFNLYQPFMKIWMRDNQELILSDVNKILFCIYFFAITMNNTRNLYLHGNGLFWECRIWYIVEAFGNLFLNVLLGRIWGVSGILVATIITILLFNFFCRNKILFSKYFKRSLIEYYLDYFLYISITIVSCLASCLLCSLIKYEGIIGLLSKGVTSIVVTITLYAVLTYRTTNFKLCIRFIKSSIIS